MQPAGYHYASKDSVGTTRKMADTLELESDFSLVETLEHFPVIWDPGNPHHDKVEQRRVAFREIARICKGETVEDADYICKRYRAIRSKLVRRLKPSAGPVEVKHQSWALEEKLKFLKYKLEPKRKLKRVTSLSEDLAETDRDDSVLSRTPPPKRELPPLAPGPRYVVLPPPMAAPTDIDNVFCQMLAFSLKELPKDVALELRGQIFQLLVEAQRQFFQSQCLG